MIRAIIVFALACFLGLFIQGTLIKPLSAAAVAPDFILVAVVFLALYYPSVGSMLGAFVLGVATDFASGEFVGPSAAGATVAYCLAVFVARKIYAETFYATMLLAFFCSLMKSAMYVLMLAIYVNVDVLSNNILVIGVEALLTAIVAPIVIKVLRVSKLQTMTTG